MPIPKEEVNVGARTKMDCCTYLRNVSDFQARVRNSKCESLQVQCEIYMGLLFHHDYLLDGRFEAANTTGWMWTKAD